jgi:fumarylacetoacetase
MSNNKIDSNLSSWIFLPKDSDFPIQNIPFGIFQTDTQKARICTRIGDTVIDLYAVAEQGFFNNIIDDIEVFSKSSLNLFISLGKKITNLVRLRLIELFSISNIELQSRDTSKFLYAVNHVQLLLPVEIGDYTDFYSSKEHATNVGIMFRDPENALLPNWLHLPVGYHGRASSIVVSGTNFFRPKGQMKPKADEPPVYGPSKSLDFELEMAFIVGKSTNMGDSVSTAEAEEYIFGLTLFNDWSARDIQSWEYVPLGPFLGKNFASTMSPWVVTLEALELLRVKGPEQNPKVLPYLEFEGEKSFDIELQVLIKPENSNSPTEVCHSNFKYMYWSMVQQLAHHTVNGCNLRVGDVCASGTISGPTADSFGSMLELAWKGTKPLELADGEKRVFINDNDTVIMKGWGVKDGIRIGFGECIGKILPAK